MIVMNKTEVEAKLSLIRNNSEYVRVSDNHPLELYLGKNEKGNPTLRYNGDFQPIKVIGNALLEIKQIRTTSYNSLLFCFNSNDNLSLFYSFCEDIISQTENYSGNNGYVEIVNRYNQWKKMFYGSSKLLNENEILGLIGELLFLKDYAVKKYGTTVALNGWSGPEPTHKDFSYGDDWFEIKTINSFKNSVFISSIEQLDSENSGKLVIYRMEKMSPSFHGISLNNLVGTIMESFKLDSDRDIFIEKLKQVGYAYNEVYDNYVYNFITMDSYSVNDKFPRIKAEQLVDGIGKVQYEILISLIEKFKETL